MIAWTMPDALELLTTRRSFKAVELAGPPPSTTEIDQRDFEALPLHSDPLLFKTWRVDSGGWLL
jgi:hypothetical protein